MPDPILHKAEVRPRVEEVRGNRVLEGVEMPLALGNVRTLAVVLDEFIKTATADRRVVAREEQGRRIAVPLFQVGFDSFEFIRLQRVQSGQRVLEALNPEAVLLEVEVGGDSSPTSEARRPWR